MKDQKREVVRLEIEAMFEDVPGDEILSEILQAITAYGRILKAEMTISKPYKWDLTKRGLS